MPTPPMGVEWAMVQHGVPSDFDRNEWEEEELWRAQYEVGSQIQAALDRALQIHRATDFDISNVSAFPGTCLFFIMFMYLPLMTSARSD